MTTIRDSALRLQSSWPEVLPIGWFVTLTVVSGFLTTILSVVGTGAPVQQIARLLLGALLCGSMLVRPKVEHPLPQSLRFWLLTLVACSVVSASLMSSDDGWADAISSFGFMFGIGAVLLVPAVARIHATFGRGLVSFFVLSLAFGGAQALTQQLLLPDAVLERFGVVFAEFVNGRLRVLSFFASPPRFAEFLVFGLLVLATQIASSEGHKAMRLALMLGSLIVLYNTYSRSGYVLLAVSGIVWFLLMRKRLRNGQGLGPFWVAVTSIGAATAAILTLVLASSVSLGGISDSTSFTARQTHWGDLTVRFVQFDLGQMLFGSGESARFPFTDSRYFVVDNVYLAVALYGGLFGILAFVGVVAGILKLGLRLCQVDSTPVPLVAMLCGLMVEGLFVDNHNSIFLTILAALGVLSTLELRRQVPKFE